MFLVFPHKNGVEASLRIGIEALVVIADRLVLAEGERQILLEP